MENGRKISLFSGPKEKDHRKDLERNLKWKDKALAETSAAMPGITTRHIQPNNFEKMRVTFAYQLFSDAVLNGLRLDKNDIEAICGSIQPVLTFFGEEAYIKYLIFDNQSTIRDISACTYDSTEELLSCLNRLEERVGTVGFRDSKYSNASEFKNLAGYGNKKNQATEAALNERKQNQQNS
ncbi:hypothetical protein HPB51_028176 [Rhipicephalus microplus]|uniref:Uncharacterized protein n=1 Tax=Rhipicephalus microplus TaxID=6941 RepID=A0A9J6CYJ2_RHIMP|nr:hypothetical protein HPB51_028176 [Rhipicephalus microplus]